MKIQAGGMASNQEGEKGLFRKVETWYTSL